MSWFTVIEHKKVRTIWWPSQEVRESASLDPRLSLLRRIVAFPLQYFHNRSHLTSLGDCGFFDGHGAGLGAVVAHGLILAGG